MTHLTISTLAFSRSRNARTHPTHSRTRNPRSSSSERGLRERVLLVPPEAPDWIRDPDVLWTAARQAEDHPSARYAMTITLDLPRRGTLSLLRALVESFVCEHFTAHGRAVEATITVTRRAPSARLTITTRRVGAHGIGERVYPLPDAQQLLALEASWNQLCARALHDLLLASATRAGPPDEGSTDG